jgi:hypothetical protein
MARHIGPRKYVPLTAYLAARPVDEVTLTLAEVEQIIGAPLPVSARQRNYWTNSRQGLFRVRPWLAAGWCVTTAAMRVLPPTVTFARVA